MLCFIHSLYNYFWRQCPHLEVKLNPITISLITYVTREQNITTSMLHLSDKPYRATKMCNRTHRIIHFTLNMDDYRQSYLKWCMNWYNCIWDMQTYTWPHGSVQFNLMTEIYFTFNHGFIQALIKKIDVHIPHTYVNVIKQDDSWYWSYVRGQCFGISICAKRYVRVTVYTKREFETEHALIII